MIRFGIVSEVKKGFARVKIEELDGIVTDWLPVLKTKSKSDVESWPLEVNEHVVVAFDQFNEAAVILGAIHNNEDAPDEGESAGKWRKVFSDGTVLEYDKNAHKLNVDVKGDIAAKTTGKASIDATGNVDVKSMATATVQALNVKATATTLVEIEAPAITLKGPVTVTGPLAAAAISTTGGGAITSTGDITTTGVITGGQVKEGAVRLGTHKHIGVQTGGGTSGIPTP